MPEQSEDDSTEGRVEGEHSTVVPALKLTPNITAAEALAVFRRKLPGAAAEVREAVHPFWWTVLNARTESIVARLRRRPEAQRIEAQRSGSADVWRRASTAKAGGPARAGDSAPERTSDGRRMNVLVNAHSGRGFIADFEPSGTPLTAADWQAALVSSDQAGPRPNLFEVSHTARSLVRTKVVKTVKLGMGITLEEEAAPRGIAKPNWVVTGANEKFSATILVDGLDSSHYIVRVEKLS